MTQEITTPGQATDDSRALLLAQEIGSPTTLHIEGSPGLTHRGMGSGDFPICLLPELERLAEESDGVVFQDREGRVIYRTRNWTPPAPYIIPPGIVNRDDLEMNLELGSHLNLIHVGYGQDSPTNPAWMQVYDATSATRYGLRESAFATTLVNQSDAEAHAHTLLNALAVQWQMPDLTLDMRLANDPEVEKVAALDIGHPVVVETLPLGAPVDTYHATVIGYDEYLSSDSWSVDLHLAPTYQIVTPT